MDMSVKIGCMILLLGAVPVSQVWAQGGLTPSGAPAATMKTLEQIEARTPITNLPYIISQPGSYYLAGNLTAAAGQNGIDVNADDVTLDLNGFTLTGSGTNSGNGITQPTLVRNLRVHNGRLTQWRGLFMCAVRAGGENNQIDHVQADENFDGIVALNNAVFSDCASSFNAGDGFYAGTGSRLTDCSAAQNGVFGFYVGSGSSLSGCAANKNGNYGIYAVGGCSLVNCASADNLRDGIYVGNGCSFANCAASFNRGDGIFTGRGSVLLNCNSFHNSTNGFSVFENCILQECSSSYNGLQGFDIQSNGNAIVHCTANNNTSSGIFVFEDNNRLEGNHLAANDYGLYFRYWNTAAQAENNSATRNTAVQNASGNYFYVGVTNNIGPIEGAGSFASPWANFSY